MVPSGAFKFQNLVKLWLPLIFVFSVVVMYEQHDYEAILERLEIVSYNKDLISYAKVANFKYNRTNFGINVTLTVKKDLRNGIEAKVESFKFASNEYRPFPMDFTRDVCKLLKLNEFGLQNIYLYGNFRGCPIAKGNYSVTNYSPDFSKFPPYIPGGRYLIRCTLSYFGTAILVGEGYLAIKPVKDFAP